MGTLLFVIILIVVIFLVSQNLNTSTVNSDNKQTVKANKKNAPGMFFMEMYEITEKERKSQSETVSNSYYEHISSWYWTIALACQGRLSELDDIYDSLKDKECEFCEEYKNLLKTEKKQLYAMARIAQRIEDGNMLDMKNNESIGEYTDRKLMKSKPFMEKYQYYIDFDFKLFYNHLSN